MKHILIKKDIINERNAYCFLSVYVNWANKKFIICTMWWEFDRLLSNFSASKKKYLWNNTIIMYIILYSILYWSFYDIFYDNFVSIGIKIEWSNDF